MNHTFTIEERRGMPTITVSTTPPYEPGSIVLQVFRDGAALCIGKLRISIDVREHHYDGTVRHCIAAFPRDLPFKEPLNEMFIDK